MALNDLATYGTDQPQTDSTSNGTDTILFPGVTAGIHIDLSDSSPGTVSTPAEQQQVAAGLVVSLTGTFQNVVGTPGNDWIKASSSGVFLDGGGLGNDTLIGDSGPVTLVAGSGNDSLVAGTGGTTFRFAGSNFGNDLIDPPVNSGLNTLDFSQFNGPVSLDLGSTAPQAIGSGSAHLTLSLESADEINGVMDKRL